MGFGVFEETLDLDPDLAVLAEVVQHPVCFGGCVESVRDIVPGRAYPTAIAMWVLSGPEELWLSAKSWIPCTPALLPVAPTASRCSHMQKNTGLRMVQCGSRGSKP